MAAVRRSIQSLQKDYDDGNRAPLESLVKAWRGIMALPPYHPNSFFCIGGFHGEPFRGPGVTNPDWWGGYCNHANVLFPTWHRAYLLRLENALRSIDGCEDVRLPYWDETLDTENPIPAIFTSPTFPLVGGDPNPLYSYALQEALVNHANDNRYTKHRGYQTVRYPLSGLVGTEADRANTANHNEIYADADQNVTILRKNVTAWLTGTVEIPDDGSGARIPDTYSVLSRYKLCLEAPNYTVFSNTRSQNQWIEDNNPGGRHYVVSLESPHNAIHLAVGGFYQRGKYNASPIIGANGDMGANETASFDPIFFFHHCFIDYAFWKWQELNDSTARGSLNVIRGYAGTVVPERGGVPFLPPGTELNMDTSLYPFRKPDQKYYSSQDVTDIRELGYDYEPGSLDPLVWSPSIRLPEIEKEIVGFKRVHNINRADYSGSFVIRTFVQTNPSNKTEIGHEAVLSRRNIADCANCQDKLDVQSLVPIYKGMLGALFRDAQDQVEYSVEIHTHDSFDTSIDPALKRGRPVVDDL
ncbi:putative tyrosinase [Lasiosphaeris hirsuta]|uniref:tyrosinase n=1 Tax=Lasiosphaeris hirsuta TaxID=260670 RepID=A0AA40DY87_9PEZI|nr:putative tyrosinase [Lasiosphaeris hirsuta]